MQVPVQKQVQVPMVTVVDVPVHKQVHVQMVTVVVVPVHKQVHVPMVTIVEVPVQRQLHVPRVTVVQKTVEVPLIEYVDHRGGRFLLRHVPMVSVFQKKDGRSATGTALREGC